MQTFTSALIAASALWTGAMAQLDRECFYVANMHGPYNEDAELISNLPQLMAMYKPGMKLESITAIQDKKDNDSLSGIQLSLKAKSRSDDFSLSMVGTELEEWDAEKVDLLKQKPTRISILEDERTGGICDVVIY